MYSSGIISKAPYTYIRTYLLFNLDYPSTSRDQAAYHKRHRPSEGDPSQYSKPGMQEAKARPPQSTLLATNTHSVGIHIFPLG